MSTTQPIEDICKACLAGYERGLVTPPGLSMDIWEDHPIYVNEELAAALRIGFEAGRKAAAEATPLSDVRTLLMDGYKSNRHEVTRAGN